MPPTLEMIGVEDATSCTESQDQAAYCLRPVTIKQLPFASLALSVPLAASGPGCTGPWRLFVVDQQSGRRVHGHVASIRELDLIV